MSSIKEIAKYVGISPASVSIYLNDRHSNRVSAGTKEKIDEAVEKLNYHKNVFASSLATQESRIVGIIIPSILPLFQNNYTNALISGIQALLSSQGYSLLFFPSSGNSSVEIVREQLEKSAGCDGYILFSTGFCTKAQIRKNIEEVGKTGKPFVTLNIPQIDLPINQMLIEDLDRVNGLQYLIERGHRNILLLLGRPHGIHAQSLKKFYAACLSKAGIRYHDGMIIYGKYEADPAYQAVTATLQENPHITALCAMSDLMGAAAAKAIQDSGRSVPDDISIIGRNNSVHSRLSTPALTTIDLHIAQAGRSAANLLLEAIEGNTAIQKITISGSLIERSSVKDAK